MNEEKLPSIQLNKTEEMTEKRNLGVSLEEAREWYKGGNVTLKKLALTAYTMEELELSYDTIMLGAKIFMGSSCLEHPTANAKMLQALNKLNNLAFVFNGGWKKPVGTEGFFLAPWSTVLSGIIVHTIGTWSVLSHENATFPGIVYFRKKADAIKALEIATREGWVEDLK